MLIRVGFAGFFIGVNVCALSVSELCNLRKRNGRSIPKVRKKRRIIERDHRREGIYIHFVRFVVAGSWY